MKTSEVIVRRKWTELPILADVIDQVKEISNDLDKHGIDEEINDEVMQEDHVNDEVTQEEDRNVSVEEEEIPKIEQSNEDSERNEGSTSDLLKQPGEIKIMVTI